jgi:DNA-binding NarL/FixJ family response regulator
MMTQQLTDGAALLQGAAQSLILPTPTAPTAVSEPSGQADLPAAPRNEFEWPLRVLIVDDAVSTRRLLRGVLEYSAHFDVAGEADNGTTAIEMAEALQPDVVLLDLSMPVSDGSSALRGLLTVAPKARVIILSGMDDRVAPPLLGAGAAAFVQKGLAPFELLERLSSILGRSVTSATTTPTTESPAEPTPQAQLQAIICDDDTMTRRLVAQVLAKCDVAVTAETDVVPKLLTLVELVKPEFVLLDLWLEGTTGASALPEIRKLSPRTAVVVYSAHEAWKSKALDAGAAAFAVKPHFDHLETVIRQLTRTASPLAPNRQMAMAPMAAAGELFPGA